MSDKQPPGHIPRVYLDQVLTPGTTFELTGDRFHHLRNVLRLGVDDPLVLFNGQGGEFPAHITHMARRVLTIECGQQHEPARESGLRIVLGQGVARGDRMDYAIAKAVELGVTTIQPLITQRGKVRMDHERSDKKQAHWRRVAIAAAEQSGRTRLPAIPAPCTLAEWLPATTAAQRLVLDPQSGQTLGQHSAPCDDSLAMLVGPESGLSRDEIEHAKAAGFASLSLGPRVLRTETAGVAALAAMQTLWGDLSQAGTG